MKYLSDVRICTSKRDIRRIKEELAKVKSNIWDICDIKQEFIGNDGLLYVLFGWDNIEWYLNYKDIFVIEQTLKRFKAEGIQFKFIRIGQDAGDVEQDSYYDRSYIMDCAKLLQAMMVKV